MKTIVRVLCTLLVCMGLYIAGLTLLTPISEQAAFVNLGVAFVFIVAAYVLDNIFFEPVYAQIDSEDDEKKGPSL